MGLQNKTDNRLGITFNLESPEGCISAANKNVHRVMPKINKDADENEVGIVSTGMVNIEVPKILRKKKKSKNTRKTKRKKQEVNK